MVGMVNQTFDFTAMMREGIGPGPRPTGVTFFNLFHSDESVWARDCVNSKNGTSGNCEMLGEAGVQTQSDLLKRFQPMSALVSSVAKMMAYGGRSR
jgi:hypothetical protein